MFLVKQQERRARHASAVEKFLAKTKTTFDSQPQTIANIDQEIFYQRLKVLAERWFGIDAPIYDCDGKRLINNLLLKEINNLVFIAIVADRLDYFIACLEQQKDNFSQRPLISWLEGACICGAKNVVCYMLDKFGLDMLTKSNNIIPYAISSGDADLVMQIVLLSKDLSVTNPGLIHLYSCGHHDIVDKVQALFSDTTPTCVR